MEEDSHLKDILYQFHSITLYQQLIDWVKFIIIHHRSEQISRELLTSPQ